MLVDPAPITSCGEYIFNVATGFPLLVMINTFPPSAFRSNSVVRFLRSLVLTNSEPIF